MGLPANVSAPEGCFGISATAANTEFTPTALLEYTTMAVCVVNGLLDLGALTANILVFVAVTRKAELRTLYNTSILCLAFADLLVSLLAQPAFIAQEAEKLAQGKTSCMVNILKSALQIWCSGLAAATLNVITLERYFAIFRPFKYQNYATRKRIVSVMVIIWLLWTTIAFSLRMSPEVDSNTRNGIGSIFIISDLILTSFVYVKIYRLSKSGKVAPVSSGQGQNWVRSAKETKAAKTVVYITGALFLNHVPVLVAFGLQRAGVVEEQVMIHVIFPLAETFLFSTALLDPMIYVWRNTKVRLSMRQFLMNLAGRQDDIEISNIHSYIHSHAERS